MSLIEHWIGVRMAAGYDVEDFRELVEHLNVMRSVAEAVVVESAEVPQPQGAVSECERLRVFERAFAKVPQEQQARIMDAVRADAADGGQ